MNLKYLAKAKVKLIPVYNNLDEVEIKEDLKSYLKENNRYTGKEKSIYAYLNKDGGVILVGLGEKEKLEAQTIRESFFEAAKIIMKNKIEEVELLVNSKEELALSYEGLLQFEYKFDRYKRKKEEKFDYTLILNSEKLKIEEMTAISQEVKNIIDGVFITRDLVNIPSIDMYPESLANFTKETLSPLGVEVEIYGREEIEKLGMKAYLAVAEGSDKEAKLIVMKYEPNKGEKFLTYVGKGLTYDSGGYAIKSPAGMFTMKSDMGGAAAVIGAIYAIAKNNIKQNIVGVVAACENMIDGSAYKNGDIISSMKGTTIEVINTDAEGRITLADALYYAATKINSESIIDLATLTGACIVALGDKMTGSVSNNDELYLKVEQSFKKAGEHVHRFSVIKEHRDLIKGKDSDIINSTGRLAGAITAGIFLEEFVENVPWVHLDIAGPSFADRPYSYIPRGASGIPVKSLYELAKNYK